MTDRLPWFRCFPSALLGALAGLDPDEGLTYVTALLRIYETGGPVAETGKTLSRRTGLPERRAAAALERLIEAGKLLRTAEGRLDSATTHEEIRWQTERRGDQSAAGKASAAKRQQQAAAEKNAASDKSYDKNEGQKTQRNQQIEATSDGRPSNHLDLEEDITPKAPKGADARKEHPEFAEWFGGFPPRFGTHSRAKAARAFASALKNGASAEELTLARDKYRDDVVASGKVNTQYVKRAEFFLSPDFWPEYLTKAKAAPPPAAGSAYLTTLSDDRWRDEVRRWRNTMGAWDLARHTSPPDAPTTKVPAHILREFNIQPRPASPPQERGRQAA